MNATQTRTVRSIAANLVAQGQTEDDALRMATALVESGTVKPAPRKRAKREVEAIDYLQMVKRTVRAAGKRVSEYGDEAELLELIAIRDEAEQIIGDVIRYQNEHYKHSALHFARILNTTRQNIWKTYLRRPAVDAEVSVEV